MTPINRLIAIAVAVMCALLWPSRVGAQTEGMMAIEVPDSLVEQINRVLSGKAYIKEGKRDFDPTEKVLVKGDTAAMVLRDRNIGRFSRGLSNYLFIPRKSWQFGLTANYGEISTDDIGIFDIISDVDISGHIFSIKPYIAYFIADNLSLGMRMGYSSSRASVGSLAMEFDDDLNFNLSDVMYRNKALTAAIFARQYIGLSRKGRFGVFNEVELAFSSGNSDFRRQFDGQPKLTNTTYTDLRLNFSPGLCVLINKYVSFNVSFAVVGFYMRNEKQSVDGVYSGNRFTSGANFKFNIFNINFGLGIHL